MDCPQCSLALPTDGDHLICGKCSSGYHFNCSTVSQLSWRSMGPERKKDWRCIPCKEEKQRMKQQEQKSKEGNKANDSVFSQGTPKSQEVVKQISGPTDLTQVMDRFGEMESRMAKMFKESETKMSMKIEEINKDVGTKLSEFEATLSFYGDKVDEATSTVKELQQKMVLMEKRLDKSEAENTELKTRLRNIEIHINEIAQKEYNKQIEITGVKDKNVDAQVTVSKIMEKAGIISTEVPHKVQKVTRAGENRQERTSIHVFFPSQEDRNRTLAKIKKEKVYTKLGNSVNTDLSPISINEALCPYYKRLFFEANRVKKEQNYAFLWTKDGKILLKKSAEGNAVKLSCMDDLGKL